MKVRQRCSRCVWMKLTVAIRICLFFSESVTVGIPEGVTKISDTAFKGLAEFKKLNEDESKIIIYGKEGSYAQTYALEHPELFTFVIK